MTKRHFYTSPLNAVWAKYNLGLNFTEAYGQTEFEDWGDFLHWSGDAQVSPDEIDDMIYVAPESIPAPEALPEEKKRPLKTLGM
jgi:hypothetical protein